MLIHILLTPLMAGLAMLPFALPMFLTPRLGAGLSDRYSGRAILTLGLAITACGNFLIGILALTEAGYPAFVSGMLLAGAGAGILNSETAKALQGAVPVRRAGMASGLSATTRFVGLLLGVAIFGAVLSDGIVRRFSVAGAKFGLDPDLVSSTGREIAAGNLAAAIPHVPDALSLQVRAAATDALSGGFATASFVAAVVAIVAGFCTFKLVRAEDTLPTGRTADRSHIAFD